MRSKLLAILFAAFAASAITQANAQSVTPYADYLFIGSYHMNNPGRDVHNTQADDVLSERRQREIAEAAGLIERYRPTRIMLEVDGEQQEKIRQNYAESCKGSRPLGRSEAEQLGCRIACSQGLEPDKIYAVDSDGMGAIKDEESINYPKAIERHQQQKQYEAFLAEGKIWADNDQRVLNQGSILDMLKNLNSDQWLRKNARSYYLVGLFGTPDDPIGANWVQYWFGRNLAIFNNIARNTAEGDRILVIYGAGHGNYLRQMAAESGIYRIHEPLDLLSAQ